MYAWESSQQTRRQVRRAGSFQGQGGAESHASPVQYAGRLQPTMEAAWKQLRPTLSNPMFQLGMQRRQRTEAARKAQRASAGGSDAQDAGERPARRPRIGGDGAAAPLEEPLELALEQPFSDLHLSGSSAPLLPLAVAPPALPVPPYQGESCSVCQYCHYGHLPVSQPEAMLHSDGFRDVAAGRPGCQSQLANQLNRCAPAGEPALPLQRQVPVQALLTGAMPVPTMAAQQASPPLHHPAVAELAAQPAAQAAGGQGSGTTASDLVAFAARLGVTKDQLLRALKQDGASGGQGPCQPVAHTAHAVPAVAAPAAPMPVPAVALATAAVPLLPAAAPMPAPAPMHAVWPQLVAGAVHPPPLPLVPAPPTAPAAPAAGSSAAALASLLLELQSSVPQPSVNGAAQLAPPAAGTHGAGQLFHPRAVQASLCAAAALQPMCNLLVDWVAGFCECRLMPAALGCWLSHGANHPVLRHSYPPLCAAHAATPVNERIQATGLPLSSQLQLQRDITLVAAAAHTSVVRPAHKLPSCLAGATTIAPQPPDPSNQSMFRATNKHF